MHQPSQILSPLFQSNSRIPPIFQPATHQYIEEKVCHRFGYGARLASSKSPKSERETAMDGYLVVVVETRKHERRRRHELLFIPFHAAVAIINESIPASRHPDSLANSRRQNSQCHRNSHHARIHSMPPSLTIQHHRIHVAARNAECLSDSHRNKQRCGNEIRINNMD